MPDLGPLIFEPLYRPKVWGGRHLERLLGKPLPPGQAIGETWELADLPEGQSVVAAGPARGRTLAQLVREWGADLLGRARLDVGRFPLLIKFLDARENLSLQVHPDAEAARRIGGGARPKEEAYYVLDAAPEGCIYRGFKPGVTASDVVAAVAANELPRLVNRIPVRAGQSFHVPAGMVHALGAGVVVAEIETPSDTTYRLYDWGRTRPPGDAGLHVEPALQSIRFDAADPPSNRTHVAGVFTTVTRLVSSPAFNVEKVRFVEGMQMQIPYAEPVVWVVIEGRGAVTQERGPSLPFKTGDVVLLPAALRGASVRTETDCTWLEVTIPVESELAAYPRPDAATLSGSDPSPGVVQLGVSMRPKDER